MPATLSTRDTVRFSWGVGATTLQFLADNGPIRLVDVTSSDAVQRLNRYDPIQPLVEILTPRYGRARNTNRTTETTIGTRLRYLEHRASRHGRTHLLAITQRDDISGLVAESRFEIAEGTAAFRTRTTVSLVEGAEPLTLWAISSFATGAVISDDLNELEVWSAQSQWMAENQWRGRTLRSPGLARIQSDARGETSAGSVSETSASTWSTGTAIPAGAATHRGTGTTLAWQIEHNGAWHWELGERPDWARGAVPIESRLRSPEAAGPPLADHSHDGAYLTLFGPTDLQHNWTFTLTAQNSFTTVPVAFALGSSLDDAFGELTRYRRAFRRDHEQNRSLPVVFNDYMSTLEGDPTESKLLPLIQAAASVGADYFCIDAGWYDDTAGWWASVGDWMPSSARFPRGIGYVIEHIRSVGLVPGLWLEPEVVGTESRAAGELPESAFMLRGGERIREHDRYFLDLRSSSARAHLDAAIDRLISDFGIGYFKFDYNVIPGAGPGGGSGSPGHELLEHNRALIAWLTTVLDRHPGLIIENCASGGLRSDFAMLENLQLQSTSDQNNPLLYPAIAVGALAHILPEQAANWAYPQPTMTDNEIAFAVCAGLAGRMYLAGVLNKMNEHQLALVRSAVGAHKLTKHILAGATPRFPLGLPTWDDGWVVVAFDAENAHSQTLLVVWKLPGAADFIRIPLPHLGNHTRSVQQIFPQVADWNVDYRHGEVTIHCTSAAAAGLLRLT